MSKPKIFCYSTVVGGGEGTCYAIAEDGVVLGSHFCSEEIWLLNDLGVTQGARPDRHETYAAHYPNGYEMEFVPAVEVDGHAGLENALRLNWETAAQSAKRKGSRVLRPPTRWADWVFNSDNGS